MNTLKSILGYVIFFMGLIGVGVLLYPVIYGSPANAQQAGSAAERFGAALYPGKRTTTICQQRDTDGNGYVSCTIVVEGQDRPIAIECADRYSIGNNGCRMVRGLVTQ